MQGNLQELTYKNISTATLVVRLFRALIAIIVIFNLNYWQGDAVNAFINSIINKVIYIKCPDRLELKVNALRFATISPNIV